MRVSERVHPTADLTPAPHKMCNKLLKFASCCMQYVGPEARRCELQSCPQGVGSAKVADVS